MLVNIPIKKVAEHMKTRLSLELIGFGTIQQLKAKEAMLNYAFPKMGSTIIGKSPSCGWVAEIKGVHKKFKFNREFITSKLDYTHSNSTGSRGIYAEYILEEGKVYEVFKCISWARSERFFCKIVNCNLVKIDEKDVLEWAKNYLA